MQLRVYYEYTDCGGIVYHSHYLNFCERARSEHFFSQGIKPEYDGYSFVVKKIEAEYIAPAMLGDMLEVSTQTQSINNASLTVCHQIYRAEQLLFKALVILVCVKESKAAKIPAYFKEKLHTWN